MKNLLQATFLITLLSHHFLSAQGGQGVISNITDGDSFELMVNDEKFEIRLNGIDCPEIDQPYGLEATDFVKKYLYHQVEYVSLGFDKYDRVLADVYVNGVLLNSLLIDVGLAWHYKAYSTDQTLFNKEITARQNNIGIWSQENPIAPWDWRIQTRTSNSISHTTTSTTNTISSYQYSYATSPQTTSDESVIICGGQYATKYHQSSNCRGLSNCKGGLYQTTKSQAEGMGRSPCAVCY